LDATYVKARDTDLHQVVSRAVVIATGVTAVGDREVLGLAVGDSEDETFWTEFLRSLRRRGLAGVRLVISDAHEGLKAAARKTLQGASWQRCRVHFARNVLARVPKGIKTSSPPPFAPCSSTPPRRRSRRRGIAPATCSPASSRR
jgi:putative transposase